MGEKLTTSYTQTVVPSWYSNYAQDILSNQQTVSGRPFTPYDASQRIAGFNPTQQQGFQMTGEAATGYQPLLGGAIETAGNTLGRSSLGAAAPFIGQAANQQALRPAYGALGQSAQMTAASTNPTGLGMAMPYLGQASQSAANGVGNFMNPFIDNVVNRYGELGARTLQEQLMPAIQNKYIQNGQLGGPTRPGTGATGAPSGMMTDATRALRDVQEGVAKQQQAALSEGYNTALSASQAEQQRMGQLAQTAGGLGFQQQQVLGNAGQQMGALGQQYANIGLNQQQLMSTLGGQVAQMYGTDTANQMATSGQLSQFAQQMQQQGLAGANAVTGAGNQQQALEQAQRDANYQEFLRASGYDQAQIDNMTRSMQGVSAGVPQGQVAVQSNKGPSPSTLGAVAGAGLSLAGSGVFGQG
jgi:hypothetical protein